MTRSTIILVIAIVLGLGLGLNLWIFVGLMKAPTQPETIVTKDIKPKAGPTTERPAPAPVKPVSEVVHETEKTQKPTEPEPVNKPSEEELLTTAVPAQDVTEETASQQEPDDSGKEPTASTLGKPEPVIDGPVDEPVDIAPPPDPPPEPEPGLVTALKEETNPFPWDIHEWMVRPYQKGCVATLSAIDGSSLIDPFEPERLAMYVYYESGYGTNLRKPDWFGFVAPGRGEMSAKLITPEGELVRGITGSTGLSWNELVHHAQKDMEFRLTQCDLDGNCTTHVNLIDLSALTAVAVVTFECANASTTQ